MDEDGTFNLVAVRATGLHRLCHGRRTAGEHTNLSHIVVELLQTLKEAVELRAAKVSHRAETTE